MPWLFLFNLLYILFGLRLINVFLCYLFTGYLSDHYSSLFGDNYMLSKLLYLTLISLNCNMVVLLTCVMLIIINSQVSLFRKGWEFGRERLVTLVLHDNMLFVF